MNTFKEWMNESFTGYDEKIMQSCRRIISNVHAIVNRINREKSPLPFSEFQKFGIGYYMHRGIIYDWLVQRMRSENPNQEDISKIQNMINNMINAPIPRAKSGYKETRKGFEGIWCHWVINGDMARSDIGTNKVYIPVHYSSLISQLENTTNIMHFILKNLIDSEYLGQIKISKVADSWIQRMDNFVLHSGDQEMTERGANIVAEVLKRFKVRIGGLATTGEMEKAIDFKGSHGSFNDTVADMASNSIARILNNTRDYDHFIRNINNHFKGSYDGSFFQEIKKMFSGIN